MLLTAFVDALPPQSLAEMPFVNSLSPHRARMRTVFGYSVTCIATMFSGVYPNKHFRWFIWEQNPQKSMYSWAKDFSHHPFETTMVPAYLIYRAQRLLFQDDKSYYGVKYISGAPFRYWPKLAMTEVVMFTDPGYLKNYPTLFDLMRQHQKDFQVHGIIHYQESSTLQKVQKTLLPNEFPSWVHLSFGDVDRLSHLYGPDSSVVKAALQKIDKEIERFYLAMSKQEKNLNFFLWSDHGQAQVKHAYDLKKHFSQFGEQLEDYFHHIDNNYARFWFNDYSEQQTVTKILSEIEVPGYVLTDEISKKYHVNMPDNRYGDLIYYLDLPYCFKRPWNPLDMKTGAYPFHHGFLPDHADMDGVFAANRAVRLTDGDTHVRLIDILPTFLETLKLPIPDHCEGTSLWQK